MGTAHVLDAVRQCPSVRAVIVVTTDKVYRNQEWIYPYRESDELGGGDPYSASKSAGELVTDSYRYAYFRALNHPSPAVATVRAGNVIGGGDWSDDRLMPDLLRALDERTPIRLRYPNASRPWQRVLDPLAGYLVLAERLLATGGISLPSAWNFGPDPSSVVPVITVVDYLSLAVGSDIPVLIDEVDAVPEAHSLSLDSTSGP